MTRKLSVGIVNFLNSRPLAWGFLQGRWTDRFDAVFHPPARVADLLAAGELDIGLIPAIEVQRIPGLSVLPDLCVAATHEVRSVLLIARRPVAEIRRVALDLNSRTSAALVRILLADRHGLEPEYVQAVPDVESMLVDCDAALVIGDPALQVDRDRYRILDLAAEWRALTGKPAVFAVWAVGSHVEMPDLPVYFEASLRQGLAEIETLIRQSAAELALPEDEVRTYLLESLSYSLGREELAGLTEYYRRAARHGLIPAAREIALWPSVTVGTGEV
jgi:chorismate dehydratase